MNNNFKFKVYQRNDLNELVEVKDLTDVNLPDLSSFAFQEPQKELYFRQEYADVITYSQISDSDELAITDGNNFINFDAQGNFICMEECKLTSSNVHGSIDIDIYEHEPFMSTYQNGFLEFYSNDELFFIKI